MQVQVNSVHFSPDSKLVNFIESKLNKLDQFHDQILGTEVFLKIDRAESIDNKIAEIKMSVPGKDLFAKKQGNSFEEATDVAVEALRKQIRKYKAKIQAR